MLSTPPPATPPAITRPFEDARPFAIGRRQQSPFQVFRPDPEADDDPTDDNAKLDIYTKRVDRESDDWFDALEKQLAIIEGELTDPNCDETFWNREKMAVQEAMEFLTNAVAPIDTAIRNYENTRHAIIVSYGEKLKERIPGSNLPEFLIRDDPQGYLRW
jgi:hypothetical protein